MNEVFFVEDDVIFSIEETIEYAIRQLNLRSIDGEFELENVKIELQEKGAVQKRIGFTSIEISQSNQHDYFLFRIETSDEKIKLVFEKDEHFKAGTITLQANDSNSSIISLLYKWLYEGNYASKSKDAIESEPVKNTRQAESIEEPVSLNLAEKETEKERINLDKECRCHLFNEENGKELFKYTKDYTTIIRERHYDSLEVYQCNTCFCVYLSISRHSKHGSGPERLSLLTQKEKNFVLRYKKDIIANKKDVILGGLSAFMERYQRKASCNCHQVLEKRTHGWYFINDFTKDYETLAFAEIRGLGLIGVYTCNTCTRNLLLEIWRGVKKYDQDGYCAVELSHKDINLILNSKDDLQNFLPERTHTSILNLLKK